MPISSLELCCCTSLASGQQWHGEGKLWDLLCHRLVPAVTEEQRGQGWLLVDVTAWLHRAGERTLQLRYTLDTQQVPGRTVLKPSRCSRILEEVARITQGL